MKEMWECEFENKTRFSNETFGGLIKESSLHMVEFRINSIKEWEKKHKLLDKPTKFGEIIKKKYE